MQLSEGLERMDAGNKSRGRVPMVKIDGRKIRDLRESKGLTQLYIATAVEVTTDTISRWENRRYPSVKRENALKLAETLEVDINEIIDVGKSAEAEGPMPKVRPLATKRWRRWGLAGVGVILAITVWRLVISLLGNQVAAVRIMPAHSAPGQPFPVLLKIVNKGRQPSSFILREHIPTEAMVVQAHSSSAVTVDPKTGSLKCLGKIKQTEKTLGYVLTNKRKTSSLVVNGTITSRTLAGRSQEVKGDKKVVLLPFHWADKNMDNKIDDQEILAVYDEYSEIKGLKIDMDLIEDIWFGSSYHWNPKTRKFVITP